MRISFRVAIFSLLLASSSVDGEEQIVVDCDDLHCHPQGSTGRCMRGYADFSQHPRRPDGQPLSFLNLTSMNDKHCECKPTHTGVTCNQPYMSCYGSALRSQTGGVAGNILLQSGSTTLLSGESIVNKELDIFLKQQIDGSLEVIGGNPDQPKSLLWKSGIRDTEGDYFTMLRADGILVTKRGKPDKRGETIWKNSDENRGKSKIGIYYLEVSYDLSHINIIEGNPEVIANRNRNKQIIWSTAIKSHVQHVCYNNGKCLPGDIDKFGNKQYFCDCRDAFNDSGDLGFVGLYCEIPTLNVCDAGNKEIFCVNNGICNKAKDGCVCSKDFGGAHCEFHKNQIPDCSLACHNGGKCELGFKSYRDASKEYAKQNNWKDQIDFMHCSCPPQFYGVQCEIESTKCGDHDCFHGGTCFTPSGGIASKQHCDCTMSGKPGEKSYAGRYCQYESSSFCTEEADHNGHTFCVNGGVCNASGTHLECICPEGYSGALCEFANADQSMQEHHKQCNLKCHNNGSCRKGSKDISPFLQKFGVNGATHLTTKKNIDGEHCVCPEGWIGLQCETPVNKCSAGLICLNGGTCTKKNDVDVCDCSSAIDRNFHYAGRFCEHQSTNICTESGKPSDLGTFCTNGGLCASIIGRNERHKDCHCPPEFTGRHCEHTVEKEEQSLSGNNDEANNPSTPLLVAFTVCIIVVIVVVIAVTTGRTRRRSRRRHRIKRAKETGRFHCDEDENDLSLGADVRTGTVEQKEEQASSKLELI